MSSRIVSNVLIRSRIINTIEESSGGGGGISTVVTDGVTVQGNGSVGSPVAVVAGVFVKQLLDQHTSVNGTETYSFAFEQLVNFNLEAIGNIYFYGDTARFEGESVGIKSYSGPITLDAEVNAGIIISKLTESDNTLTSALSRDASGNLRLTTLPNKQDLLVSGTNIKTINGESVLGSGNISVLSSVAWGDITGSLEAQTDLNLKFNTKQDALPTSRNIPAPGPYLFDEADIANITAGWDYHLLNIGADTLQIQLNTTLPFPVGSWMWLDEFVSISAVPGVDFTGTNGTTDLVDGIDNAIEYKGSDVWILHNGLPDASSTVKGLTKLYANLSASNTDGAPSQSAVKAVTDGKQATLVSGTNIKTVNGSSLLGSGDISISTSVAWGSITGTLSSQTDLNTALSGKISTTLTSAQILVGNGGGVATAVSMSGGATISNAGVITLTNASVTGQAITGYTSGAGTVSETDTILQAIQKLNGNDANKWAVSGATTITTPTLTGIPTFVGNIVVNTNALGVTQVDNSGIVLVNTTAAAAGAQQISPSTTWESKGWKTTATAASQAVSFTADVLPVQGTTAPTGIFRILSKVNAVASTGWFNLYTAGSRADFSLNGLQIQNGTGNPGGISLNGSTPVSNQFIMTQGFTITSASGWAVAGTAVTISPGTSITATSGTQIGFGLVGSYIPTSGTGIFNAFGVSTTVNQTGGANGAVTLISLVPTYTAANTVMGIDYNPTITSVAGGNYGVLMRPTTCLNGFGLAASMPTAIVHIAASTTARASLCLAHGAAPSSPVDGDMWTTTAGAFIRINGVTKTFTLL